jgi:hypothetical protein
MEEIWKQIENYENYSVSSLGQVRNDDTKKILKGCNGTHKRLVVNLCKNGIVKQFLIYRLVAFAFIPNPAEKSDIDHIDNNPSNNRIENLRWATRQENLRNTRIKSTNTSGIKGISWDKSRQKWETYIQIDGIKVHIGRFNTIEEATLARQTRANQAFGVFTNACETNQS